QLQEVFVTNGVPHHTFVQPIEFPRLRVNRTVSDEVFYIDNLFNDRPRSELRLLPSLINAEKKLSQRRFKLEVWFRFSGISPSVIPIRLDMQFNAIQNR
ncbi:MAG: hypothetical protein AAF242_15145, partial [Bacteroidota bacterium]